MMKIQAATVQFQHKNADKEANFAKIEAFCADAAASGVSLLCFPECCISGYWFLRNCTKEELLALAEPVFDGPSSQRLLALARRYNMVIGAGLVEREGDHLYNTYVVACPDGALHKHRKIHAFEHDSISSGDTITVFDTPLGVRVGVLICYDNNIGENVRMTALSGAEILLAPHQTGGCRSNDPNIMGVVDRALWDNRAADPQAIEAEFYGDKGRNWLMRWLPARAHDNGLFLLFSNGVGPDDDEVRTGNAMILDPYGRILGETWAAADRMVVAELDLSLIKNSTGRRWMTTRRPDLYGPLAISTGLERDVRSVRFDGKGA